MSPTTLLRRRDLHDVAEKLVHLGVSARDLGPAMRHAHAGGLFLEIGVLAAGHFVQINLGAAGLGRGVERRVDTRAPVPSNRKTR